MVLSQSACIVNCAMPGKQLAHMVDRTGVAVALLTALRDLLATMAAARASDQVFLADTLGTLTHASSTGTGESGDWANEIHPTPHGYSLLAREWRPQIEACW